jgi:2-haloacid dehalogenase
MAAHPSVLVFDVNETLLDIRALEPHFGHIFGDPRVLREWFGQLVMYSMTLTLAGRYVDFFSLGRAVLEMTADVRGVAVSEEATAGLMRAMGAMPVHPDVAPALDRLRDTGYRLVTLTNSPPQTDRPTPLEHAGIGSYFERQFSVDELRVYKPATVLYSHVAEELGAAPTACMMVAAHVWDTIGAQAAGFSGALITRPGNGPLPAPGVPQPDLIAADVLELAQRLESSMSN